MSTSKIDDARTLSWLNIGQLTLVQLKRLAPLMALIYVPVIVGIATFVLVTLKTDLPLRIFFIDTVSEFDAPMYIGLISNFGVLLWCLAASVCLFGGWLLFARTNQREIALFLICSGLVSAVLMLDDLYLLHEEVLPDHLFIPQKLVFLAYAGMVLAFLVRFARMILLTDFILLLAAFAFFAVSVYVDLFVTPEHFEVFGIPGRHLIEDGFKTLGIVSWTTYFVRTSYQLVTPFVRSD